MKPIGLDGGRWRMPAAGQGVRPPPNKSSRTLSAVMAAVAPVASVTIVIAVVIAVVPAMAAAVPVAVAPVPVIAPVAVEAETPSVAAFEAAVMMTAAVVAVVVAAIAVAARMIAVACERRGAEQTEAHHRCADRGDCSYFHVHALPCKFPSNQESSGTPRVGNAAGAYRPPAPLHDVHERCFAVNRG